MLGLMPFLQLVMEANHVIGLRLMKIATDHPDVFNEIHLMVSAKIEAATEAGASFASGRSVADVVERYREHEIKLSIWEFRG